MSELYCNNGFCVSAGSLLSIEKDNENEMVLAFAGKDEAAIRARFRRTDNIFSNFKKLQRIKGCLKTGDLITVAGYKTEGTISVQRFSIWSGTICHDRLLDEYGNPLTVVTGKIRSSRFFESRPSIYDPSRTSLEFKGFSVLVQDHSSRQIWNIRISGALARQNNWEAKAGNGAVIIGHEMDPCGFVHLLNGEMLITVEPPVKATA